jgi:hypothetical protein
MSADPLLEFETPEGRPLVIRVNGIAVIFATGEPGRSILVLGSGREFRVCGEVADLTQALLPEEA